MTGCPPRGDQFDITKPGEPDFEFTDIDESDQIGLTSFASPGFAGNRISNDERVWSLIQPGRFDDVPPEAGDYVFLYGSGSFPLRAGETKRFSIALIVGESFEDLILNAETVQQIYDVGYRFAKPPNKPTLKAIAGDQKVTLYWDAFAEQSEDPLSRENDFEGYVLYRSTDHEFSDIQTITDINGSKFLFRPLTNAVGVEARFDLENGLSGPSAIPFPRRGVSYDLGDDTGLFHTYVDSNQVMNGQTYYYALGAYDRGFSGGSESGFANGIPPSETSKTITFNPVDDTYIFDVNTVSVIPGPEVAGYVPPRVIGAENRSVSRLAGHATGTIRPLIIDPSAVKEDGEYAIRFEDTAEGLTYSVEDQQPVVRTLTASAGKAAGLGVANIIPESFSLTTEGGATLEAGTDYVLNAEAGTVQILGNDGAALTATFRYRALANSNLLNNEEANIVFDGIHLFVENDRLQIDSLQTGWSQGGNSTPFTARVATAGPGRQGQPFDYEIVFANSPVSTAFSSGLPLPFRVLNLTRSNQEVTTFVPDINRNGVWDVNEQIIFLEDVEGDQVATWEVVFEDAGTVPGEGDVFFLRTEKPFSSQDAFSFTTTASTTSDSLTVAELGDIYVVPNPYVATTPFETHQSHFAIGTWRPKALFRQCPGPVYHPDLHTGRRTG